MSRDRTVPLRSPAFADAAPTSPTPHRFRLVIDVGVIVTLITFVFGAGVAWNQFQSDGKRLDDHEQEIRALTQLQQQQQQTQAAMSQSLSDIRDTLAQRGQ